MQKLKCIILGWYYTIGFYDLFLMQGLVAGGHDVDYTSKKPTAICKRCGEKVKLK